MPAPQRRQKSTHARVIGEPASRLSVGLSPLRRIGADSSPYPGQGSYYSMAWLHLRPSAISPPAGRPAHSSQDAPPIFV